MASPASSVTDPEMRSSYSAKRRDSISKLPSKEQRASLASQAQAFHENAHQARDYWTARRVSPESVERFLLGYDESTDRITIPYLTPAGPWTIKRRCLHTYNCKSDTHVKYLNEPGVDMHLFNASALIGADQAAIVEGELDAVVLTQLGIPAVAYPGTQHWQKHPSWRWCFDSLTEVVVVADGDDPGRDAAAKVAKSLRESIAADVRIVQLPNGHDSNSFLVEYGEDDLLTDLGY